jgi:hypothetical protein
VAPTPSGGYRVHAIQRFIAHDPSISGDNDSLVVVTRLFWS